MRSSTQLRKWLNCSNAFDLTSGETRDIWARGELLSRSPVEHHLRFWAIERFLRRWKGALKCLEAEAISGYYSIRLAEQRDGLFVLTEKKRSSYLQRLLQLNEDPRLFLLETEFSPLALRETQERFDCLFFLHGQLLRSSHSLTEQISALLQQTHCLIFETLNPKVHHLPISYQFQKALFPRKKCLSSHQIGSTHWQTWAIWNEDPKPLLTMELTLPFFFKNHGIFPSPQRVETMHWQEPQARYSHLSKDRLIYREGESIAQETFLSLYST